MDDPELDCLYLSDTPDFAPGMCHAAAWRNQISSAWSSNPHQEDGSVLEHARHFLIKAQAFLSSELNQQEMKSMLDPSSDQRARSALLVRTHREVPQAELEVMSPERRAQGIAIRGSSLTAIPLYAGERVAARMAHIGISRASKVEIHHLQDERILVSVTTKNGQKQQTITPDAEDKKAAKALFVLPEAIAPPDPLPIVARAYPVSPDPKASKHIELPSWVVQRVGQVLQDGFRFHALLSAAATDASRAVVLDKVLLSIPQEGPCQLVARLHETAGRCICCTHGRRPTDEPHYIQISFSFCGKRFGNEHNRRCFVHHECRPNFAPELPICCLHKFECRVRCKHRGTDRGLSFSMEIPEDSVERMRILAAAAMSLVTAKQDEVGEIKDKVDAVFRVGEGSGEVPDSSKNINRDVIAVRLLRAGGVERTIRGGTPSLSCKSTKLSAAEHGLRKTHAHLFKKRRRGRR